MFHILIVDDDKHTQRLLKAILTAENYTVFTADNGEAALELMEKEHIDLVVLDIMMPKMATNLHRQYGKQATIFPY